jgi:hypothetical protein
LSPWKVASRLSGKRVTLDHFDIALRNYAKQVENELSHKSVDVVFSTSSIPLTALRCKQPIISWGDAVFHGMLGYYPGSFSNMTENAIRRAKKQEETALRLTKYAVYSSNWAADHAKKLVDASKVAVLPFGASLESTRSEDTITNLIREKRSLRPNACNLLFCGVDWDRKGGDIALETARILNSFGVSTKLRIVGCRPPISPPAYVEIHGFIDKNAPEGKQYLRKLFEDSDIFLLPTKAEAAGVVFCEAAAFGLPCLTFDTGGTSDYVRDGFSGFCFPLGSSANQFADAARSLMSQPDMYIAFAFNSYMEYKTRLNWNTSVSSLVGLFRNALGSSKLTD